MCCNIKEIKLIYYKNPDAQNLADHRKFWKTVKPVFRDKIQVLPLINPIENGDLVNNDLKLAKILNKYSINFTD